MTSEHEKPDLMVQVVELCREAGAAICALYNGPEAIDVDYKSDSSPLTEADKQAHNILVAGLKQLTPAWPVLSEEHELPPYAQRCQWPVYWLVDPLDGTREFIERTGEFTVNVALIENGIATMGVVYVPMDETAYTGVPELGSAMRVTANQAEAISISSHLPEQPLRILTSSRAGGEILNRFIDRLRPYFPGAERLQAGSALKFCHLAEGNGDIYPRFSPCCEWDTAAGQAVLEAAGGSLVDIHLNPVRYNQGESIMSPNFYALGRFGIDWPQLLTW